VYLKNFLLKYDLKNLLSSIDKYLETGAKKKMESSLEKESYYINFQFGIQIFFF